MHNRLQSVVAGLYVTAGMPNNGPPFAVKWVLGIAGTVIAAALIAKFNSDAPSGQLVHFSSDGGVFDFKYPDFLQRLEPGRTPQGTVTVTAGSEPAGWTRLFAYSGQMSVTASPREFASVMSSKNLDSTKEIPEEGAVNDILSDAVLVSRRRNLASDEVDDFYTEKRIDGLVHLEYWYVGEQVVLLAVGLFPEEIWEHDQDLIRKSFESIEVDEQAARTMYEQDGWVRVTIDIAANDQRRIECRKTYWSPDRAEAAGCAKVEDEGELRAHVFQCGERADVIALVGSMDACHRLQRSAD